jgi:hypothetical protein
VDALIDQLMKESLFTRHHRLKLAQACLHLPKMSALEPFAGALYDYFDTCDMPLDHPTDRQITWKQLRTALAKMDRNLELSVQHVTIADYHVRLNYRAQFATNLRQALLSETDARSIRIRHEAVAKIDTLVALIQARYGSAMDAYYELRGKLNPS